MPIILAGSLGGQLQIGGTLDYSKAGNDKRKLRSLYLSIMDRMGLKLSAFGDAKERLTEVRGAVLRILKYRDDVSWIHFVIWLTAKDDPKLHPRFR